MKIKIKRIDKSLPLPIYETKGSVGFDFLIRKDTLIKKGEVCLVPCNVIVEVPKEYVLIVASRSSTPRKKGLLMPHGVGILDQDYCGPNDEVLAQFYNFSNNDVLIKKGEKIVQGIFMPVEIVEWQEADELAKESRGGFGGTDTCN